MTVRIWGAFLLLFQAQAVFAQSFGLPVGRGATVTPTADEVHITFQPSEWPNALWSAGTDKSWDWSSQPTLAFDASNTSTSPLQFNVRVDDDLTADGVHHCRTGSASLGAGQSGQFFLDMAEPDSKAVMGMNGGPPVPGRSGLVGMSGSGTVDPAHIVAFQIFLHQPPGTRTLHLTHLRLLASPLTNGLYTGIVDTYGQYTRADWPGKLHSASEFAVNRETEEETIAKFPHLVGRDSYGGWAKGPTLPPTGFFHTVKRDGRWWLVTPQGHLFLSFGIDTVNLSGETIVQPRSEMFTWLPPAGDPLAKFYGQNDSILYGPYKSGKTFDFYKANLQRKYGPDYETLWRRATAARFGYWGFNTIGNWSDDGLETLHQVPYTATLGVGGSHVRISSGSDFWSKMHDPFDPQFAADCDSSFREKATRLKNDRWCLGWFVDNELSWAGGTVDGGRYGLAYGALSSPAGQPAKAAFLRQLQTKYGGINKLNVAWGTTLADWAALEAPYTLTQTPNDVQKADFSAFVYTFAKQYFTVVRDTLKKYDPNHLYLGCRFAWYSPDAVRAAGEVCDVVSFNIYEPRLDPKHWAFTKDLGKPCLIGEFHFGALDRGLFHPGLVSTPNQAARAAMFEDYMGSVIDNPAFVGAHWFQYIDEPLTGRPLDGENYNIGFVTVTDRPYPEMVQAARHILGSAYPRRGHPAASKKKQE